MRKLSFGGGTLIMGVINVTPDSFYIGSRVQRREDAVERALDFEKAGADVVDVSGLSTRPGAEEIDADEETERVIPVIEGIRKRSDVLISVDTYRSRVAVPAIACGARIVNDISGLRYDERLPDVVRNADVHIVLMHIRGKPANMQSRAAYRDVVDEISDELDFSVRAALEAGISPTRIILDPGIGFAKTAEHNLALIKYLPKIKEKGYPVLIGLSRKSFLGAYTGLEPEDRLIPTVAANAISIFQGADIIRVHDVKEAKYTAAIADAIKNA
jgi:dihydropteroate synthase